MKKCKWIFICFSACLLGCKSHAFVHWQQETLQAVKKQRFYLLKLPTFSFWKKGNAGELASDHVIFPDNTIDQISIVGFLKHDQTEWILAQNSLNQFAVIKPETLISKDKFWVEKFSEKTLYLRDADGKEVLKSL